MRLFFTKTVPALIVQRFDEFLALRGSIAFDIEGETATVCFADPDPVREGLDPAAGLTVRFTEKAFAQFTEGTLDVVGAIRDGSIRATGDFELLNGLATLMRPLQSNTLGWSAE